MEAKLWQPSCFLTIWNPDKLGLDFKWSTSLDRYVKKESQKNIFFIIKRFSLDHSKFRYFCQVFKWSGFQMPGTGIKLNPKSGHGQDFGCWCMYFTCLKILHQFQWIRLYVINTKWLINIFFPYFSCPLWFPKAECLDKFDSLSSAEKNVVCSCLFYG
jgi:hypothetical protein